MPCEIDPLNGSACRVDYRARDQRRRAVFLRER